jgi:hypothetical protein
LGATGVTLPTLLLAVVLATLYGAGFHLAFGGGSQRLLFYLVAGWVGFAIGHFAGAWFSLPVGAIGALNAGTATLASALTLLLAHWLIGSNAANRDRAE